MFNHYNISKIQQKLDREVNLRKVLLIILIIFTINVFADVKENEILKRRANQFKSRKQYERAINIYEIIEKDSPDDIENICELIMTLVQISKIEKAEKILNKYKNKMKSSVNFQLKLMILLHKAEFEQAKKISNEFLDNTRGNINNYGTVAKVFEQYRQYETAVSIYLKARKASGDDKLFIRELAYNYQAVKDYENSVIEFVKLAENKYSYTSLILNRFTTMLAEDASVIRYIKNTAGVSKNPAIKEVYALCLGDIGEYEKALQEYEALPAKYLLKFADRMKKNERSDLAIRTYKNFLARSVNVIENAKIKIMISQIYIENNQLRVAEEILLEIYHDNELQLRNNKYKTRANRNCRELLAQLYLMQNVSQQEVIQYLEEAKNFAYNKKEKNEIEYKIIHLLILNGDNDLAKTKLRTVLNEEDSSSDIFKKGYYYSFLIAVMTKDTEVDSLLGELLINIPENVVTNDALKLIQIINQFQNDTDRKDFLKAYKKELLYKNIEAINILRTIYARSELEEVLILAGEWAIKSGEKELAIELFLHEYTKGDLIQYADLKLTEIEKDNFKKNDLSRSFLQSNPQSIFSPQFRMILEN